ncbi:MAG: hypothetical protein WCG75_10655 [Armatimonadota bacterium]
MEDSAVWKALADDTRRQMLDSLRQRPSTTGELCEKFPHLDRCTVMKHICVLENSKLITFRREGRNRLNFLNPVELQKVHERWLSSYTAQASQRLLDLKKLAEENAPAMTNQSNNLELHAHKYAFEVEIKAPAERVWDLMSGNDNSWFPSTYNSSPHTKGFVSEQRIGGLFYEDYGNGDGKLMGTIIHYEAGSKIQIQGSVAPDWGGPATHILCMHLVPGDGSCTLKIDDSIFGVFPDEMAQMREASFRELFGNLLKQAAEK